MEHGAVIKHDQKESPKTGAWRYMHPEVDKEKCIGCGACVPFCPEACMILRDRIREEKGKGKKIVEVDFDYCKGCGVCAAVCPLKAITMKKK